MISICRRLIVVGSTLSCYNTRSCSSPAENKELKKSVIVSQSKDIFTNLALEDWYYKNFDFTSHHVLMLWQNEPCVVIGRHQNPWSEANIFELNTIDQGVKLARRNSGGGTVFHDEGNLNMTFFSTRERYNRKYNLEIIARALLREFGLKLEISDREDLTFLKHKVSGTAAKLGRPNAYHHCTLLVDVNKVNLKRALQKPNLEIKSNATKSTRSAIINLRQENPEVNVDNVMKAVGREYLRTFAIADQESGMEMDYTQNDFQMINPTEEHFPGIQETLNDLMSWKWRYGRTPKFTITKSFSVQDNLITTRVLDELKVTMLVEGGVIKDVNCDGPPGLVTNDFGNSESLIGHKFSKDTLDSLEEFVTALMKNSDKLTTESVSAHQVSIR